MKPVHRLLATCALLSSAVFSQTALAAMQCDEISQFATYGSKAWQELNYPLSVTLDRLGAKPQTELASLVSHAYQAWQQKLPEQQVSEQVLAHCRSLSMTALRQQLTASEVNSLATVCGDTVVTVMFALNDPFTQKSLAKITRQLTLQGDSRLMQEIAADALSLRSRGVPDTVILDTLFNQCQASNVATKTTLAKAYYQI